MIIQMLLFWLLANSQRVTGFLVYFWYLRVKTLDSFSVFFSFTPQMGLVSEAFVAEYWVKAFFFFFDVEFAVEADFDFLEGLFLVYTFTLQGMSKFVGWTKLENMLSETENVNWVNFSAKSNSSTSESFKMMLSWKLNGTLSFALCSFFLCLSIYMVLFLTVPPKFQY